MKIVKNLISKSPKIALILIILFAIGWQRDSLFGNRLDAQAGVAKNQKYEVAQGYSGPVPVSLIVDKNGNVEKVVLGANSETPRFVESITSEGLLESWNGLNLEKAANFTPDAISGATYTSMAIIANVRREAAYLSSQQLQTTSYSEEWIVGQIAVLAVVLLALISYIMPAKTKPLRLPLLILSVGVLGFWQGAFMSVQLLYGWVINGSSTAQIVLLAIAALSVALPLIFNKAFYCTYLCPFGALQELASKIPVKKIVLRRSTYRIFRYVKQAILVIFVVLIFVLPQFQPADWEPFTAFIINSAAIWAIIIAAISVIASVFIPKAWCRLLCPTGEILQLMQRKQNIFKK